MTKIEKNILHRIQFERTKPINFSKIEENKFDDLVISVGKTIATQMADKVDEAVYDLLYRAYKDTECDELIILDLSKFKRFILKYLPMYIKDRDENKGE